MDVGDRLVQSVIRPVTREVTMPVEGKSDFSWSSYWKTREPSVLVLTVVTDVRIDVAWTDSAELGADGYRVYISTDNVNWTLADTIEVGEQALSITELTQATLYYIKVVAYKDTHESTGISDFAITLPSAFVGGVANTRRYPIYNADYVNKSVDNYVTAVADMYGSGDDLVPVGTNYPLWTSDGIKIITYGTTRSVVTKAFTLNHPCEVYVSCKVPTWASGRYLIYGDGSAIAGIRQAGTTPGIVSTLGYTSSNIAFPLNEFHVCYFTVGAGTTGYFGVDGSEQSVDLGPNAMAGLTLGGTAAGAGNIDAVFREAIVRDVISSEADRKAIARYLTLMNFFFLNKVRFDNNEITFDRNDLRFDM